MSLTNNSDKKLDALIKGWLEKTEVISNHSFDIPTGFDKEATTYYQSRQSQEPLGLEELNIQTEIALREKLEELWKDHPMLLAKAPQIAAVAFEMERKSYDDGDELPGFIYTL